MAKKSETSRLDAAVDNLKKRGVALPKNAARAKLQAASMHEMASMGTKARHADLTSAMANGQNSSAAEIEANTRLVRAMGSQRRASSIRKSGSTGSGDVYAAIPRFYDPLEYWDLSGLPWNVADEGHRHKLHKWLRLYYATHYLVPILIDIFTRFPLVGMSMKCKDKHLQGFYEDLFFDQLDYAEFLVGLGREYWTVGEAFPLGSFDEDLGVWESEELINPEDIVIENFPLLGSKQLKIVPPQYLKKLAQSQSPAKEYKQLQQSFPELIPYLLRNEHIPISSVLLKQVANKHTTWDDHGTPILLRGLRTLIHEEKLLASQDAIAERLYSPLILARLGVLDLGDGQGPWVPSPDELDAFRDDMDLALSSDFRLLVHHFGLEIENVFGREQMPRLGDDFDRIERRIMQIFGVNPSLLSAGSNSQPYASSALQAEFLNQILRTFQDWLKRHFKSRALVVAEAQEHYDYDNKGGTRIPIFEEVVIHDEETGEKRIEERHKLLIPELEFETLDLRDEATERQFLQTMRAMGVPIPDNKLMVGVQDDISEYVDEYNDELVEKTIKQQEAKMKTYKALKTAGLPIPPDLKAEVESVLNPDPGQSASPGGLPPMGMGGGPPPPGMGGPPPPGMGGPGESIVMPSPPDGLLGPTAQPPVPGGGPPPISPNGPDAPGNGFAPPASFERRPGMPRPSSVQNTDDEDSQSDKIAGNIADTGPMLKREEAEGKTIHRLPKAAKRKSYSFIDEDAVQEPSEIDAESAGPISSED